MDKRRLPELPPCPVCCGQTLQEYETCNKYGYECTRCHSYGPRGDYDNRSNSWRTPRTAQQSEAVIAKALGKNLTVVKEGA